MQSGLHSPSHVRHWRKVRLQETWVCHWGSNTESEQDYWRQLLPGSRGGCWLCLILIDINISLRGAPPPQKKRFSLLSGGFHKFLHQRVVPSPLFLTDMYELLYIFNAVYLGNQTFMLQKLKRLEKLNRRHAGLFWLFRPVFCLVVN